MAERGGGDFQYSPPLGGFEIPAKIGFESPANPGFDFQYSPDGFTGVSPGDMGGGGEGRVTSRLGWLEYLGVKDDS